MKRWIVRLVVPVVLAGSGVAMAATPAQAIWVDGGWYQYLSTCRSVGQSRVNSGMYDTYTCERDSPGYRLRGWV